MKKIHNHPLTVWRFERGLTLTETGALIGVSPSLLCEIENRKKRPSPGLARRIAKATGGGVTLEQLARM